VAIFQTIMAAAVIAMFGWAMSISTKMAALERDVYNNSRGIERLENTIIRLQLRRSEYP